MSVTSSGKRLRADQAPNVAVVRLERDDYQGLKCPFHPDVAYPELRFLGGALAADPTGGHAYRGVRSLFELLGYDRERRGTTDWNPLGWLIDSGATVALKPNWVRHYNGNPISGRGSLDSVVTHPALYRPVIDYCLKAAGQNGTVVVADAPQMDCQFDVLMEYLQIDALVRFYQEECGYDVQWRDLRDEAVIFEHGLVQSRRKLAGDPEGYQIVDLGSLSAFEEAQAGPQGAGGLDESLLRGADYDERETIRHHSGGRHEYKISGTILNADVVINLPKVKTHKKAGVTLALKNLVGINCNKNFLPHHRAGPTHHGGDEFPGRSPYKRFRSWAIELCRPILRSGRLPWFIRMLRMADLATRPTDVVRSGNWYGNDTVWRTILDLNRVLRYADRRGEISRDEAADRKVLTIFDGIVAAEARGPMDGDDRPLGVLVASEDPLAGDLALCRLLGFDWSLIPKIREALESRTLRFTSVQDPSSVVVTWRDEVTECSDVCCLRDFEWNFSLEPHPGWAGHIELSDPVRKARTGTDGG